VNVPTVVSLSLGDNATVLVASDVAIHPDSMPLAAIDVRVDAIEFEDLPHLVSIAHEHYSTTDQTPSPAGIVA
jgi:hypothetical protein